MSRYQKGKTNLDFTKQETVSGSGISWAIMQVCTSLQTDNHASTPPLSFLQAGCPSCRPTNSVKALKAVNMYYHLLQNRHGSTEYEISNGRAGGENGAVICGHEIRHEDHATLLLANFHSPAQ